MKFENIKAGDTVYIQSEVRTGWNQGEYFWIPQIVEKITPKQFQVNNAKYRKEDGSKVSSDYSRGKAMNLGDACGYSCHDKKVVTDQTLQRRAFIKRLNMVKSISDMVRELKVDHEIKHLEDIHAKLVEITELIKGE